MSSHIYDFVPSVLGAAQSAHFSLATKYIKADWRPGPPAS